MRDRLHPHQQHVLGRPNAPREGSLATETTNSKDGSWQRQNMSGSPTETHGLNSNKTAQDCAEPGVAAGAAANSAHASARLVHKPASRTKPVHVLYMFTRALPKHGDMPAAESFLEFHDSRQFRCPFNSEQRLIGHSPVNRRRGGRSFTRWIR